MIAVSIVLIALTAAGCFLSMCATGRLDLDETEVLLRRAVDLYLLGMLGIAVEIIT